MLAREEDTLFLAVRDFIFTFSRPPLASLDQIYLGYNNNLSLPTDGNDFCVASALSENRRGTTLQHFAPSPSNEIAYRTYYEIAIQIDCYSADLFNARYRAEALETIARTESGVDLFAKHQFDLLYADGLRDVTGVLDSDIYVSRWTFNLYLGIWKEINLTQQYFNTANVNVVNVDSRFPPK